MGDIDLKNEEHINEILNNIKNYYENNTKNRFYYCVMEYDKHKKVCAERFKNKYANDEVFREKKKEQLRLYQQKKRDEKKKNNI